MVNSRTLKKKITFNNLQSGFAPRIIQIGRSETTERNPIRIKLFLPNEALIESLGILFLGTLISRYAIKKGTMKP